MKTLIRSLICLLALTLAACSVLKIDVDVYKGSLANNKDVQVQQLAAMAVGAEPLLTRLEEDLSKHPEDAALLQNVRDVISLYQKKEDELSVQIQRAQYLFDRFKSNEAILRARTDSDFFQKSQAIMKELKESFANDSEAKAKLWKAYKELLLAEKFEQESPQDQQGNSWRRWEAIFEVSWELASDDDISSLFPSDSKFKESFKSLHNDTTPKNGSGEDNNKTVASSNYAFDFLSKRTDILEAHAEILFKENPSAQSTFIDYVREVAASFNDTRGLLHELILTNLNILGLLSESDSPNPLVRAQVIKDIANFLKSTISIDNLKFIINQEADFPQFKTLKENLDQELNQSESWFWGAEDLKDDKYERVSNALEKELIENPRFTAYALILADQRLIDLRIQNQSGIKEHIRNLIPEVRRIHGLTRGPYFFRESNSDPDSRNMTIDQVNTLFSNIDEFSELLTSLARGLAAQGRLAEGLYAVIEEYINEFEQPVGNYITEQDKEKAINIKREKLLRVLVRFSQKLLFVANHDSFFTNSIKPGSMTSSTIQVLQSIGNTILIQADELTQRDAYNEKQERLSTTEFNALAHVYNFTPDQVIRDALSYLAGDGGLVGDNESQLRAQLASKESEIAAFENSAKGPAALQKLLDEKAGQLASQNLLYDLINISLKDSSNNFNCSENPDSYQGANYSLNQEVFSALQTEITTLCKEDIELFAEKNKGLTAKLLNTINTGLGHQQATDEDKATLAKLAPAIKEISFDEVKSYSDDDGKFKAWDTTLRNVITQSKTKAISSRDEANNAHEAAKKKLASLEEEKNQKDTEITDKVNEKKQQMAAVREVEGETLKQARSSASPASYGSTLSILQDQLANQAQAQDGQQTNGSDFEGAMARLGSLPIPKNLAEGALKRKTQKDVLDDVIAALRQEYIRSVELLGRDNQQSENIAAAIEVAQDQRSNMIYIRQAASYLRSSYPSTSLQDASTTSWRNLLFAHGLRTLPFKSWIIPRDREALVKKEIDKQFWQNINTVQVSGAGRTNYVIVKDDIGNWYVKGYSSNPEQIINSAQQLALFNLGKSVDADLLSALPENQNGSGQSKQPTSWRTSTYSSANETYLKSTKELYDSIQKKLPEIKKDMAESVKDEEEIKNIVDNADSLLNPQDFSKPADESKLGKVIINQMRAMERYYQAISSGIQLAKTSQYNILKSATTKVNNASAQLSMAQERSTKAETNFSNIEKSYNYANTVWTNASEEDKAQAKLEVDRLDPLLKAATTEKANAATNLKTKEGEKTTADNDLTSTQTSVETAIGKLDAAQLAARTNILDQLKEYLRQRQSTVDSYETTVKVLAGQ